MTGGGGFEDRQVLAEGKETKHFVIACGRLLVVSPRLQPPAQQWRMFALVDMGVCSWGACSWAGWVRVGGTVRRVSASHRVCRVVVRAYMLAAEVPRGA